MRPNNRPQVGPSEDPELTSEVTSRNESDQSASTEIGVVEYGDATRLTKGQGGRSSESNYPRP